MALTIEPNQTKAAAPLAGSGPGLFGIRKRNRARLVIALVLALVSLGPLLYMVSLSFQQNGGLLGATQFEKDVATIAQRHCEYRVDRKRTVNHVDR